MAQLLRYWIPSTAPAGITFYTGDNFSRWQSNLLVGALKDQMLERLDLNGEKVVSEERLLKNLLGRIRYVSQVPNGYTYLLPDEFDGILIGLSLLINLQRTGHDQRSITRSEWIGL